MTRACSWRLIRQAACCAESKQSPPHSSCLVAKRATPHYAHLPRALGDTASSEETIPHCLASLGFNDRSHESLNVESIRKEPELIAVWLTPHGSVWSSSSQTVATIRKHPGRWSVTFISRSSSVSAESLSTSLSNCVPTHVPTIEVEVDSTRFLDLR